MQGVFMVSAFTLMLAYLGEHFSAAEAGSVFAFHIAGNVASNLFGRMLSAAVADALGLAPTFLVFAGLNLVGAALVWFSIERSARMRGGPARMPLAAWREHLGNPALRASFATGFCILFAFIGTFTFVNFVLVAPPFGLGMMRLGAVYLVFAPSLVTTLLVGRLVARVGVRRTVWISLAAALAGLPLLLGASLPAFLLGLALVACGTFAAQAAVTGFVGRAATADRGVASGIYLACYFAGGLAGTAVLGPLFDRLGWSACVAGIAAALGLVGLLAFGLRLPMARGLQVA